MKKEMRDTMENRKGQKPNRRGGLAGKLAVALTVLLIAGGRIPHLAAGHVQRA